MKKVLLIGDSTRFGYDIYLKHALKDYAKVYFPTENCMYAEHVLRRLHDYKYELKLDDVDVIHWNAGLWDCLTLFHDGTLTPIDVYAQYIERICKRIKILFPTAKAIFATSSNIVERLFTNPDVSYRKNSDVAEFNKVAVEIVKKYDNEIDDIFEITKDIDESYYVDCSHLYTEKGTILILGAVLKSVCDALDLHADIDATAVVKNLQSKIDMSLTNQILKQLRNVDSVLGV
jgi:hypothetical protein